MEIDKWSPFADYLEDFSLNNGRDQKYIQNIRALRKL
jgi:hypothetical protein